MQVNLFPSARQKFLLFFMIFIYIPRMSEKPLEGLPAAGVLALMDKAGARRVEAGPRDRVRGITASGTTPYVLAAMEEAARRGTDTWLLTCSRRGPETLHVV